MSSSYVVVQCSSYSIVDEICGVRSSALVCCEEHLIERRGIESCIDTIVEVHLTWPLRLYSVAFPTEGVHFHSTL